MYKITKYFLKISLCSIILFTVSHSAHSQLEESYVKAQLINDLIPYFSWKDFNTQTLTICTVGREPVYKHLKTITEEEEKTSKNNNIDLYPTYIKRKTAQDPDNFKGCNILYVSISENIATVKDILRMTTGQPIITISSIDNFAESGGIIGLVIEQGSVDIYINKIVANKSKIVVDGDLLGIAETVGTE